MRVVKSDVNKIGKSSVLRLYDTFGFDYPTSGAGSVDADGESVSILKYLGTLAHYIHDRRIESSRNN